MARRVLAVAARIVPAALREQWRADALREPAALWAPLARQAALPGRPPDVLEHRDNSWLWVFARLAERVDIARAGTTVVSDNGRPLTVRITFEGHVVNDGLEGTLDLRLNDRTSPPRWWQAIRPRS